MNRGLILILSILLLTTRAYAYELVLPKEKKNYVTTNYAFFVGKTNGAEMLTINGEHVPVASNGAFAHTVKLKDGENRIMLRSAYGAKMYKFCKLQQSDTQKEEFNEFIVKKAVVLNDNTPLRSTPVDAGLNRIGHLFEGTDILIDGEQGEFYRVFLSKNKSGWIAKKHVVVCGENKFEGAEFLGMESERFKNASVQSISFSKKLPYTVEDKANEIIFRVYNPEFSGESVYNLNMQKPKKYTYYVTLDDGKYTFKVRNLPETTEDATVVIDAGHGGSEKGAIGCLGDQEKDINLKIAQELNTVLEKKGIKAFMTRECDCNLSLDDRVKFAKDNGADLFVSIHLNSIGDAPMNVHTTRGTSVYYYNNNSKKFAEKVEKCVVHSAGTHKDGVKTASFAVIRPPEYAGILVECAYMTNPFDSVLYTSDDFIKKTASGIANGIVEFIKEK